MTKYIIAVRYDAQEKHINFLKRLYNRDIDVISRKKIVQEIYYGTIYYTAIENSYGRLQKGDEIILYKAHSGIYLTTTGNATEKDNLGNLPRF